MKYCSLFFIKHTNNHVLYIAEKRAIALHKQMIMKVLQNEERRLERNKMTKQAVTI